MHNHVSLQGRLTADPELRPLQNNASMLSFTLAVDRDYVAKDSGERGTDFINCVAFRATAEFLAKYFAKGDMVLVHGRLAVRNWRDQDGNKRRNVEVIVDEAHFCGSRRKEQQAQQKQDEQLPSADEVEAVFAENDLYNRAVEIALELQTVSANVLQRRMRISFVAASEMLTQMEVDGIVEPSVSGPARVKISREQWQARKRGQQPPGQDGVLQMSAEDMAAIFGPPGGAEGDGG